MFAWRLLVLRRAISRVFLCEACMFSPGSHRFPPHQTQYKSMQITWSGYGWRLGLGPRALLLCLSCWLPWEEGQQDQETCRGQTLRWTPWQRRVCILLLSGRVCVYSAALWTYVCVYSAALWAYVCVSQIVRQINGFFFKKGSKGKLIFWLSVTEK